MNDNIPQPSTIDDLKARTLKWLEAQGYPWEMRVATAFRNQDIAVTQAGFFNDLRTGTIREIDVEGFLSHQVGKVLLLFEFYLECKSSRSKPLVVLQSGHKSHERQHLLSYRSASAGIKPLLEEIEKQTDDKADSAPFRLSRNVGYGLVQAKFGDGQGKSKDKLANNIDGAYAALSSVTACCESRIASVDGQDGPLIMFIAFPVIAIQAPLFACYSREDGNLSLEEINRADIVWRQSDLGAGHIITVVTESSLDEFIRETRNEINKFVKTFEQQLASAADAFQRERTRQIVRALGGGEVR